MLVKVGSANRAAKLFADPISAWDGSILIDFIALFQVSFLRKEVSNLIPEPSMLEPEGSEMEYQNQKELIIQLKKAKEDRQYTIQRMLDEILLNGDSVSEATLKRVFKPGSEDEPKTFNMEHTLLPIAKVLLRPEETPVPDNSPYAGEIVLLKAELRVQAERVEHLREQNSILEDRVAFMRGQIDKKDLRMDEKDEMIRKLLTERDALRQRLEEVSFGVGRL